MACGMCGPGTPAPQKVWEHTAPDGTTSTYLTQTEARVAATMAGGGTIRHVPAEGASTD